LTQMQHAKELARAVVCFVEYQVLCGRSRILSEALLRSPIGEFLNASQGNSVEVEFPYPNSMQPAAQGRRRSADYCLRRRGGAAVVTDLVETKWVNGKRDLRQEIINDVVRLEGADFTTQTESVQRYLVVAGESGELGNLLSDNVIASLLGGAVGATVQVPVMVATGAALQMWRDAAPRVNFASLPLTMRARLMASESVGGYECMVWRIMRVSKRSVRAV
jgi:hypothetical protein